MTIYDRVKSLFTSTPVNSSSGMVLRNYADRPRFEPQRQVTGITYKAIDKIGLSLSVYEPQILNARGVPVVNHPLMTLFNRPNPHTYASDFIHLYGMLFEIYGETFWYIAKGENTQRPKELYLLNPGQMELNIQEGELVGYWLHKHSGDRIPLLASEIVHDKRPNPFNEWRGMSVLERAAIYVDTEISSASFTLNYINNAASPSGIVSLPEMDRDAFTQFVQRWREGYEGPQNAGKTAFIRGEQAKFQAVGSTLKDIDQEITRKMAKDDVLMMLDVPKPLLGLTDDKGFGRGNIESLYFIFADQKLEPMMRRLDRIYEAIGQSFGREGQAIDVTHESPVPEDREYEHKVRKDLVNVALTVNEVREQLGMAPLPGGDTLTLGQRPPQEPQKKLKLVKKAAPTAKDLAAEQEQFRSQLVATNDVYMLKLKRQLSRFADQQETVVIDRINATSKAFEEWLFNIREESELLAGLLMPIVIELMEAQGEDVANFITGELLTISPELRQTVEQNIKQIAGVFNQDTIKALEQTLSEGQTAGESLAKLKKRVESVFSEAKGYRAERIARTESLRASNLTAEQVYKQNGYSRVEWFINPGACQFCLTFAGRSKEIGGAFNKIGDVVTAADGSQLRVEYSDVSYPPLHPNCTCSIVPV